MTGLTVYLCATCLPATRKQARRQATLPQKAEAAKLDAATCLRHAKRLPVRGTQTGGGQVPANLPVRRSECEGGKELGYGG